MQPDRSGWSARCSPGCSRSPVLVTCGTSWPTSTIPNSITDYLRNIGSTAWQLSNAPLNSAVNLSIEANRFAGAAVLAESQNEGDWGGVDELCHRMDPTHLVGGPCSSD